MQTWIAILRGINVTGYKKVNMKELKALCESMGLENVRTYIQSGNIVFSKDGAKEKQLLETLQEGIHAKFGFEVPVMVRSVEEWKKENEQNPFLKEKDIDTSKLHITFLADKPLKEHIEKTNSYNYEPDRFIIGEREVYVYCPNGYGNTKLHNSFFESKLKVTATTRNLRTVNKLQEMGEEG